MPEGAWASVVREFLWDPELTLLTDLHHLDAFSPAWNNSVEGEGCRLAT